MSFRWCRDERDVARAAQLFHANVSGAYISHSELQSYRALDPKTWNPDFPALIGADIRGRLSNPDDAPAGGTTQLTALLDVEGEIAGVFLVTFSRDASVPYAILEDMVVSPKLRGQGYGSKYMEWIEAECRKRCIPRQFLESGITNHDAHHLFERRGFNQVSVVMMKELED